MPFPTSTLVRSGRFTDVREIGQGSFGKVYYAKDNLKRSVAVKEALPSNPFFQDARTRFVKESQIHASLQHSNIVSVYHLEEDPQNKELYLICEYVNGGSLADYLDAHGTLSEYQTIKIATDICSALEVAWKEQIVHRDIKPSNILLKIDTNGEITSAKLGDFGVAQDKKGSRTTIHQGMSHPGTPLYMAPEQSNSANILDVRADIYALGITLWEMLTRVDYKPLCNQTRNPDLRQYNPTASLGIAVIIQRAIQNDLYQRYPTPQRMADDLRAVLAGKQPLASTLSATLISARRAATTVPAITAFPPRRSRNGIIASFLAVLLLLGSTFFVIPRLLRQNDQNAGGVVGDAATPLPIATNTPRPTTVPAVMPQPTATPQPVVTMPPPPPPTFTPKPATSQPKSCTPPPDGLISWWPGDGNANDIIGSNNGALVGGATFTAGEVGQAFSFDGIDDIVLAPATGFPTGAAPRTVAFWSKISPSDDTTTGFAYSTDASGKGFYVFPSHWENGGKLTFSGHGTAYDVFALTDLRDGLYHHVAVTYDGAIVTVYADGVPVASGSFDLDTGISAGTSIGGRGYPEQSLTGEVDEVAIWNRALSASEIQAMFSAGSAGMCKTR